MHPPAATDPSAQLVAALIPADQVPDGATVLGTMTLGPGGVGEVGGDAGRRLDDAAARPDRSFDDAARTDQSYDEAQLTLSAGGDVSVDLDSRTVVVMGRTLTLTRLEFDLLAVLVAAPRRVHTRAQLHESVWAGISSGGPRTVDVHVHRLRHKLGPVHEQHLVTVRGVGYRWDPKPEPRR